MKKPAIRIPAPRGAIPAAVFLFLSLTACSGGGPELSGPIRPPAVAGRFYPGDPAELARMVDGLLAEADPAPGEGELLALLAPHAGYVFSGRTAAYAFKLLPGRRYRNIILVGSAHRDAYHGVSIFDGGGYRTPLGVVPVNRELGRWFRERDGIFHFRESAHREEHSLEVELPFLQRTLSDFSIVPILIGRVDQATVEKLGVAMAEAVRANPGTLIVCSTDLTHFPPEPAARRIDREALEAIVTLDPARVRAVCRKHVPGPVPNLSTVMCGEEAVLATLTAVNLLGARRAEILHYSNSADSPYGDQNRVVGYGAVAFYDPAGVTEFPTGECNDSR